MSGVRPLIHSVLLGLLLASCQLTSPLKRASLVNSEFGRWKGKIQTKEIGKGKVHSASFELNAQRDKNLRVDITHFLAGALGAFALRGDVLEYYLPQKGVYYEGPIGRSNFMKNLRFPLCPRAIFDIFFEEKISRPGWQCTNVSGKKCVNARKGVTVQWSQTKSLKPIVLIRHHKLELTFVIDTIDTNLRNDKNVFYLKKR